jgi:hypothetical protein
VTVVFGVVGLVTEFVVAEFVVAEFVGGFVVVGRAAVFEAAVAAGFMARLAGVEAGRAAIPFAARADLAAAGTKSHVATRAGGRTFVADRVVAPPTRARRRVAAAGARYAVPAVEGHVRARVVVSSQDLGDDHEEVEQSAFGERPAEGGATLPFAEPLVGDVGMDDRFVGCGGARIEGLHKILGRLVAQTIPGEDDGERPESHAVKFDRFGDDGQLAVPQIDFDGGEAVGQSDEVGQDVAMGRGADVAPAEQVAAEQLAAPGDVAQGTGKFGDAVVGPAAATGEHHSFESDFAVLPLGCGELRRDESPPIEGGADLRRRAGEDADRGGHGKLRGERGKEEGGRGKGGDRDSAPDVA